MLTRKDIADYVASNQLYLRGSYGLVEINPKGIAGIVEYDNVAEYPAKFQRRVRQSVIKPEFIKSVCMRKFVGAYGMKRRVAKALGISFEQLFPGGY